MNRLTFVVFGATGDLAQKKIFPALLSLFSNKKIPQDSNIIAFSRRDWTDEDFRNYISPFLDSKSEKDSFLSRIEYVKGTFDDQDSYKRLKEKINGDEVLYHLAIQPEFYGPVLSGLSLIKNESDKIIIEKPFGYNLPSAGSLQKVIDEIFTEEQVYRMDHYLGKMGLRNFDYSKLREKAIKEIKVKILETIDIQGRSEFYESVGALRDVGQNHALAMLAQALSPTSRETFLKKIGVIQKIERGQYKEYRQEQDVNRSSETETYFKITFSVNDNKWKDTIFVIEGGKKMKEKKSEIEIDFSDGSSYIKNINEPVRTGHPGGPGVPDAYEILIEEAIQGKKEYFVSKDEVLASWEFISPILEDMKKVPLIIY
jgi:glucose-6-phosphate 1-dehydrogenase